MNTNFDRVFNLAKKSQSRLIVFDKDSGNNFVVLGIDDFEGLLDGPSTAKVVPEPVPVAPVVSNLPKDEPEQFVDSTRAEDEALLQKLNQQIADWRHDELEKAAAQDVVEPEVPSKPTLEPKEVAIKPAQPITKPVKIEPESEDGGWHRLSDVIAGSSLGKVSYEPLGEQGIKPAVVVDDTEYAEPEPLNDDPVFLEEPLG